MDIIQHVSSEIETQGLHTQLAIIKSIHMILFPEARVLNRQGTLEELYHRLCASPKYRSHSECILLFVIDRLNIDLEEKEKEVLLAEANQQSDDILESREVGFIELLTFLAYETKESLVKTNILPESAKKSKKDTAELISELVQRGQILPTTSSLNALLKKCAANDSYKREIEKVLCRSEWTETGHRLSLKSDTSSYTLKSAFKADDSVEVDSPKASPQTLEFKSLGGKPQTSPVLKRTSVEVSSQPQASTSTGEFILLLF